MFVVGAVRGMHFVPLHISCTAKYSERPSSNQMQSLDHLVFNINDGVSNEMCQIFVVKGRGKYDSPSEAEVADANAYDAVCQIRNWLVDEQCCLQIGHTYRQQQPESLSHGKNNKSTPTSLQERFFHLLWV